MSLMTIRNSEWTEGWRQENCGSGIELEKRFLWPLAESRYMAWSACPVFIHHPKSDSTVTRRRAFMLCRNGWAPPGIDASSTLIWIIPHRILSTGELGIGL